MKNFDIEAYINGELTGNALEVFEEKLRQDATFREEVEAYREVTEALQVQLLRDQVAIALSGANSESDNSPESFASKKKLDGRWLTILILVFATTIIWFFFLQSPETQPENGSVISQETESVEKKEQAITPESESTNLNGVIENTLEPEENEQTSDNSRPIAKDETPTIIPPLVPPPNIRGKNMDDEEWQALLKSIWHSISPIEGLQFNEPFEEAANLVVAQDFTMAFVQLQMLERQKPENDTLLFLKAVCLTEMQEGAEAIKYFDQMEKNISPEWKPVIDWYRGLSYLLAGEWEKAGTSLHEISRQDGHPFKDQSLRALEAFQ